MRPGPICKRRHRSPQLPFFGPQSGKAAAGLVIATLKGDDVILCQITSQARADEYSIPLDDTDFVSGGLSQSSRIRPNRLFTADASIIVYRAGHVSEAKLREAVDRLTAIIQQT
ncbi:MAG: type II toxin-antitoxin system PemK/MazF family toxin [Bryobacteraceae bacterium]|jgi:mRNA interferase MazF